MWHFVIVTFVTFVTNVTHHGKRRRLHVVLTGQIVMFG